MVVACLIIVSSLAHVLSGSRLGLVRLVTRLAKALFGQVGDLVGQVKDQVCQGQGQELDNKTSCDKRRQKFALFG